MATWDSSERAIVDALDEPALVVRARHRAASPTLLRERCLEHGIQGRDCGWRSAIRRRSSASSPIARATSTSPASASSADRGGCSSASWADRSVLVRMIDRSDAVSAEKMRVDFVANASHELRTPLSTVLGYAETLAEEEDLTRRASVDVRPHHPRRSAAHAADHRGPDEPLADRGGPIPRAKRERSPIAEVLGTAVRTTMAAHADGTRSARSSSTSAARLPPVRGDRTQLIQVLRQSDGQCGPLWLREVRDRRIEVTAPWRRQRG